MKFSLILVLFAALALAQGQNTGAPANPPAQVPEETDGIATDNSGGNIVIVTGTEPPPPTAPSTPTTPTTTPTTTTTEATTTPTTTPTTPRPTTTTTTLPPPAQDPSKFPENVGNWSVMGSKSPCIIFTGAFQIHLKKENSTKDDKLVVDVPEKPEHVTVTGDCGADVQNLHINWWVKTEKGERENTLGLKFAKIENGQYAVTLVTYTYQNAEPGNNHSEVHSINGSFFPTDLQNSLECKANQRLESSENPLYVLTEKVHFEAFRQHDNPNPEFSRAELCKADRRPSTGMILGIAVGIGLLIVGLIALVVYLFKRCRRGGYVQLDAQS